MLPRFADFLSHTSPEPHPDPEPALFLHGPRAGRAEVSVVWRADLADDEEAVSSWKEQVTACPPSGLEALPLPVREARRWLEGRADADIADTESEAQDDVAPRSGRHFLRWAGDESVLDTHVRPGDVVVVPAARGGCDEWGWNPVSVAPVMDLGRRANQEPRARDIVRLHSALFDGTQRAEIVEFVRDAATLPRTVIIERLRELSWLSPGWSKIRPSEVRLLKNTAGTLLAVEVPFTDGPTESHTGKAATEDDEGSLSSVRRVLLADH
jgi:CRISPR-associated endonuclease/helicase Cas3